MRPAQSAEAEPGGAPGGEISDRTLWEQHQILRVAFEVPFSTETVNGWLLADGDRLALVDAGLNTASCLLALQEAWRGIGAGAEDVEALVLTHHDIDHVGLAGAVQHLAAPRVIAHSGVADFLTDFANRHIADTDFIVEGLIRNGVPQQVAWYQWSHGLVELGYGSAVEATDLVEDGDTCCFGGREWGVMDLAGHSSWDTCYVSRGRELAFVGDVLLKGGPSVTYFSPVAAQSFGPVGDGWTRWTLSAGIPGALARLRDLDAELFLPGHGRAYYADSDALAVHIAGFEARLERLLERVRGREVCAYQLVRERWGETIAVNFPQRVAGTVGDLEALVDAGHLERSLSDGTEVYSERSGSSPPTAPSTISE